MKKVLYFVVLILIIFALIPWIDGLYFKRQFLSLIAAYNQEHTSTQIRILQYQNNWLHSEVRMSITSVKDIPFIELTLNESVTHGPFIYQKSKQKFIIAMALLESDLHFPNKIEKLILGSQPSSGMLQIASLVTFDHHWINHIHMPVMNIQLPEGIKMTWAGLGGDSNIEFNNNRMHSMKSHLIFGALNIMSSIPANLKINIQSINMSYQGTFHPIGLWAGNFKLFIPDFSLTNPTGKSIHIEKFNSITTNEIKANFFYNSLEQLTIQKLDFFDNNNFIISPATLTLTVNNFNAKGLANLTHFLKNIPYKDITNEDLRNQLMILSPQIITSTSTLNSDASFHTALGNFLLIGKATHFLPAPNLSLLEILKAGNLQMDIKIAIPLATKLFESYFQTLAADTTSPRMLPDITPFNQSMAPAMIEVFNEQIAELMKKGKLSLVLSMQIMTLRNEELPPAQFTQNLIKLQLPFDVINQITNLYIKILTDQHAKEAQKQESPIDKTKKVFDEWLKQGYIIQNNNDYIISLTFNNNVIQLNGKIVNLENTIPATP